MNGAHLHLLLNHLPVVVPVALLFSIVAAGLRVHTSNLGGRIHHEELRERSR